MKRLILASLLAMAMATVGRAAPPPDAQPGLEAALSYPFIGGLVSATGADRVAWITTVKGVRTIWTAVAPAFKAVPLTHATADDGQELTGLVLSPNGARAVWTRGGDHDANWPAERGLQPNPASATDQPQLTIWSAATIGGTAVRIDDGDAPAVSDKGRIAYIKDGAVWSADAAGKDKPARLFFDRGRADALAWSPDGTRLAFVSRRGDHSFVGVFLGKDQPIQWLAPSTNRDAAPVWSPDGRRVAFTRQAGEGGAPESFLTDLPHPWSIMVADVATGDGSAAWRSPKTLLGSYPAVADGATLRWAAGDRLVFRAELDGWPHLYSVASTGGAALLLTPGDFMVEHVSLDRDGRALLYDANTGPLTEDDDRRHIFRVPVDQARPTMLTTGTGIESTPVAAGAGGVAFVAAGPVRAPELRLVTAPAPARVIGASADPYRAPMVTPRRVTFTAADGVLVHGQLFEPAAGGRRHPAVIFVHGGPPRQMLLGFSYMDYYAHAYAMNQYLASRGFVVLSVNYRLGIGYGRAFQHPAKAGPAGGSEYKDVVAGGAFLKSLPGVDPDRIGIWGGSYGGYLTAMALARDSATFRAGVDFHGVHDWSRLVAEEATPPKRYEQGDWDAALKVAFTSSPVADVDRWRSPVLLIHGDDDRNVRFDQTIDLARRLDARGVDYEELVLPNEIHGFLRYRDWLKADTATVDFLDRKLAR